MKRNRAAADKFNQPSSDFSDGFVHSRKRTVACACPYLNWSVYMAQDYEVSIHEPRLKAFRVYFDSLSSLEYGGFLKERGNIVCVDYSDICIRTQRTIPELPTLFKEQPVSTIGLVALSIDLIVNSNNPNDALRKRKVQVRLLGYDQYIGMKDLKANFVGHLVAIRGNVVRISSVKPMALQLSFTCNLCGTETVKSLEDGKYAIPDKCSLSGCRSKAFTPQLESSETIAIDSQKIRLQEQLVDDAGDVGRIPRTIDCETTADLVGILIPGDIVTVTGIVKYSQVSDGRGKSKAQSSMHVLYLDVISLCKSTMTKEQREIDSAIDDEDSQFDVYQEAVTKQSIDFDYVDYYGIQEIAKEPELFRLLVMSICPSIFGHELVKAGLMLALFGGRQRYINGSKTMSIRGDSHVLVVGDPGLGKSQMLSFVASVAPRGVYVCSNTTTSGGLTVTISKEAGSGELVLEAGALALGDQGCCCIDEFDKLTEYESLLETMEQQSISIAKAGITCCLPARTSVIAAANPKGGHYNKAKTVSENLKMDSALLSRFDLIFILVDKPNEEMDRYLSEHVMNLHAGKPRSENRQQHSDVQDADEKDTLLGHLKTGRREVTDPIPIELLRKYIAYSRKYVFPRMTKEAAAVLQDFYLKLRENYRSLDTAPITTRQLESMIRLSEARARCELRDYVTRRDAEDVVELMKESLFDSCMDDVGQVHVARSQFGTGMSRKGDIKRFVSRLRQLYQQNLNDLFTYQQLYNIAREMQIQFQNFQDFLGLVNNQNYLIHKGNRVYKLCFSE